MDKINHEWAKEIPCRNVIIYGYCKKQKDGCPFKHEDENNVNNVNISTPIINPVTIKPPHSNVNKHTNNDYEMNPFNNTNSANISYMKESTPNIPSAKIIGPAEGISLSDLPSLTKLNNPANDNKKKSTTSSPSFTRFNAKFAASFTPMSFGNDNLDSYNNNIPLANNFSSLSIDKYNHTKPNTPVSFNNNNNINININNNNDSNNNSGSNNNSNNNINPISNLSTNVNPDTIDSFNQMGLSSSPVFNLPSLTQTSQNLQSQQLGNFVMPSLSFPHMSTTNIMTATNIDNRDNMVPINENNTNRIGSLMTNTLTTTTIDNSMATQGLPLRLNYPTIYPPPHSILQYHLYFPDTPQELKVSLKPNERTPDDLFIPNDLREQLVKKNLASLQIFPPGGPLPDLVQDYFGLVPLDFHEKKTDIDRYKGHKNSLYKVFSNIDGRNYVMRRIHDISSNLIDPHHLVKVFQMWKKLHNVNIVSIKDVFITTKFNDSSLCLIYDYYPKAISLYEAHFINFPLLPITQEYLWTYLIQLSNGINAAHKLDLILGNLLNWEKIIVTNNPAIIKISSIAANDLLSNNSNKTPLELQELKQKDYLKLGKLLIQLASNIKSSTNSGNGNSNNNNNNSGSLSVENKISKIHKDDLEIDQLQVESSFKDVLKYLIDENNKDKNIKDLTVLFIDQLYSNFNALKKYDEFLNKNLATELENARLFRLICKLNFIFGRIESRIDINWSESGEKFPIILFYDFVFHQVDETGKPVMDLTHVLRCLNKLDAGASEKLVLVTPDEMNCIIISYKELKDLIESTFRSLTQTS
ncbi:PAN-complex poly(A)-binding subunit PAN3 PWA37_003876 [Arxiozyma heterogenica]|uniref:PAN-complex poly(A)-binding subunit PAN3 n=1 Tax=Arxiozyma heterogenica TaxID=278026 RepID=UPI002EF033CF